MYSLANQRLSYCYCVYAAVKIRKKSFESMTLQKYIMKERKVKVLAG